MRKVIAAAIAVAALVCVPVALAASSPIVTAGATTNIGKTSATLHATVNPNGLASTYQFHYGPTSALGSVSPAAPASAGAGTAGVPVSVKLSGLSPDTVYYIQLVASNSAGSSSTAIKTFKTIGHPAPTTTTSPAVDVSRYQATLVGVVNPNGQTTEYHFDFGLTTSYGFQSASKSVPAGSTPVAVGIQLPGLQPGQVYHYRLVADHGSSSVTYGADMTFQTAPWPRPHTRLSFTVRPGIASHRPYRYLLVGNIGRTANVPAGYGCHGMVTIRIYQGRRRLATRMVPVGLTTCTYRSRFHFWHLPGSGPRRLTIKARYLGDEWDAPSTRTARVWAG
jgi:phosphodiesterase/alkaline phosphatase D-like protein